jgi:hypothetical protein
VKFEDMVGALICLLLVAVMGFGIWAHFDGPCGLYKYAKVGDVPARCVMHK